MYPYMECLYPYMDMWASMKFWPQLWWNLALHHSCERSWSIGNGGQLKAMCKMPWGAKVLMNEPINSLPCIRLMEKIPNIWLKTLFYVMIMTSCIHKIEWVDKSNFLFSNSPNHRFSFHPETNGFEKPATWSFLCANRKSVQRCRVTQKWIFP